MDQWFVLTLDVTRNTILIEMKKGHAHIILVDMNLEVNRDSGLKDGVAAESSGMNRGVRRAFIEGM
jgi:hypothetical protein